MVPMKIHFIAIIVNVTRIHNLNVIMENVFLNFGIVILMMIVVMIRMSRRIFAEIETVAPVGKNVLQGTIIVAFPVGCSVMEKMIVEIILMKHIQKCVQFVIKQAILNAKTIDVYH